jgi:glycosyltransferase involved in cell wall biosynthesis
MSKPFVSVIVPTYNRREFLPYLLHQFNYQTYPQDRMELLIIDDSPTSNQDIFKDQKNCRYIHLPDKIALGKKRNMLNDLAKGEILINQDDDDIYAQERVAHAVDKLTKSKCQIAGSSILHIYYPHLDKIYQFGPYNGYHSTAAPMAYTKEYTKTHRYPENADKAEETQFTTAPGQGEGFTEPLIQLDPHKTMICISHNSDFTRTNTVAKDPFIPQGKETNIKLKDFFKKKDKFMLDKIKELREKELKHIKDNN